MRLPYIPDPPTPSAPEDTAIISRITTRRAPYPLLELDRTLLHAPPIADGWNSFYGAIRTRTSIPADIRELIICRVAVLNKAWYEWDQHAPLAVETGVGRDVLEGVVKRDVVFDVGGRPEEWRGLVDERVWAVLCFTDEMTRNVRVRDETFEVLKRLFSEREVVEITATSYVLNFLAGCIIQLCESILGCFGW
ncbi:hypothetical protein HDV00_009028 [Rhizophlyctis rosea]|nr:hypothetical protein HDV00_009028 [Rhizophlyctis rosea]